MMKKKRKASSPRKRLISALDRACARYAKVRAGWRCERCGRQYDEGDGRLQWSHHYSRRHHGIRWEDDNFSAHCGGCHIYLGGNPVEFERWIVAKLGPDRHARLMMNKARPTKWSDADLVLLKDEIIRKTKELEAARTAAG